MIRNMKTKNTSIQQNKHFMITLIAAIVLSGFAGYSLAYEKYNPSKTPTQNTPGYITEDEASNQVNGFYEQYLSSKKNIPEESRKANLIDSYGTKNLVFYSKYYQHGFDPIVCSVDMPTSVKATNVRPGPGALVTAEAKYPDASTANIDLTLVFNNAGFGIDTITCPGNKGNLPPNN